MELKQTEMINPIIQFGTVININLILKKIEENKDREILKTYLSTLQQTNTNCFIDDSINKLINATNKRIETLRFKIILKKSFDNNTCLEEETKFMNDKAKEYLEKLDNEIISIEEQGLLSLYVENGASLELTTKFDKIITDKAKQILENNPILPKPLMKPINSRGVVFTVSILEITILLGILIGVLVLVQRY